MKKPHEKIYFCFKYIRDSLGWAGADPLGSARAHPTPRYNILNGKSVKPKLMQISYIHGIHALMMW